LLPVFVLKLNRRTPTSSNEIFIWNKGKALWAYLQLTKSLYNWLKTASLLPIIQERHKLHRIWDKPATLIPQINLQLRKLNLPSRLFQRGHSNIFILIWLWSPLRARN